MSRNSEYFYMTKDDFLAIPRRRQWNEDIGEFDSLVIIPTGEMHDSGYMCMDFCAIKNDEPVALLSGGSDVLHIEGISGGILNVINGEAPPLGQWSIDCLPCGLLRIFRRGKMTCGDAISDFEIFSVPDEKEDKR